MTWRTCDVMHGGGSAAAARRPQPTITAAVWLRPRHHAASG